MLSPAKRDVGQVVEDEQGRARRANVVGVVSVGAEREAVMDVAGRRQEFKEPVLK